MRLLLACLLLSAVAACQTTGANKCDGWKAIHPTKHDARIISDSLVQQILEHNKNGLDCGWGRK